MPTKKLLIVLIVITFLVTGCTKETTYSPHQETPSIAPKSKDTEEASYTSQTVTDLSIYKELLRYNLSYDWIDNENIIIFATMKYNLAVNHQPDDPLIIYLYSLNTKKEQLIYKGRFSTFIQEIDWRDEHKFYDFNSDEAQKILQSHGLSITGFRNYYESPRYPISVNGLLAGANSNEDMVTYNIQNKTTTVVKPVTDKLIKPGQSYSGDQSKLIPESIYQYVKWSKDGMAFAFFEIFYSSDDRGLHVADLEDNKVQSIDFGNVSTMAFTKDNQYLIALCDGVFDNRDKEIRVYNLNDNSYEHFLFTDTIAGFNVETFDLLDVCEPYIALRCSVQDKHRGSPVLFFNYQTGQQKWVTSPIYLPYFAKFSPNGNKLLVYGRHYYTETKLDSKFMVIDIN